MILDYETPTERMPWLFIALAVLLVATGVVPLVEVLLFLILPPKK